MNKTEINRIVGQYAKLYPPLITMKEAGRIARVSHKTIQNWGSDGVLEPIKVRVGAQSLIARDAYVRYILNGEHPQNVRKPRARKRAARTD